MSIIFALALLPVSLGLGIAIDYARAANARAVLQTMADAAALAAVSSSDTSERGQKDAAMAFFPRDGKANSHSPLKDAPKASVTIEKGVVTVSATSHIATSILGFAGIAEIPLQATAAAARGGSDTPVCVLALAKTEKNAVAFSGNAIFDSSKCGVHSNSSSSSSIAIAGDAKVNAVGMCAHGGVSDDVGVSPKPMTRCPRADDPFKNISAPVMAGCSFSDVDVKPGDRVTLKPGIYCGGLEIKGTAELESGLYVVKDGRLLITPQAQISGNGVTFYLTGAGASFGIVGGAKIDIKAMRTGDYKGMVLVQDRSSNVGATNTLIGNADTKLSGVVYAPTQNLRVMGSGNFTAAGDSTQLIADTVRFSGSSSLEVNFTPGRSEPVLRNASGGSILTR